MQQRIEDALRQQELNFRSVHTDMVNHTDSNETSSDEELDFDLDEIELMTSQTNSIMFQVMTSDASMEEAESSLESS